jgi:hypothetical protein
MSVQGSNRHVQEVNSSSIQNSQSYQKKKNVDIPQRHNGKKWLHTLAIQNYRTIQVWPALQISQACWIKARLHDSRKNQRLLSKMIFLRGLGVHRLQQQSTCLVCARAWFNPWCHKKKKKVVFLLGVVAHIYNSSYSRGRDQKDCSSRLACTKNSLQSPSQPIKAGHGDACMSSQQEGKHK